MAIFSLLVMPYISLFKQFINHQVSWSDRSCDRYELLTHSQPLSSYYFSPSYHAQGLSAGLQLVHFQHRFQQCIDRTLHLISPDPKLEDYVPSEEEKNKILWFNRWTLVQISRICSFWREKHKYNYMIHILNSIYLWTCWLSFNDKVLT